MRKGTVILQKAMYTPEQLWAWHNMNVIQAGRNVNDVLFLFTDDIESNQRRAHQLRTKFISESARICGPWDRAINSEIWKCRKLAMGIVCENSASDNMNLDELANITKVLFYIFHFPFSIFIFHFHFAFSFSILYFDFA